VVAALTAYQELVVTFLWVWLSAIEAVARAAQELWLERARQAAEVARPLVRELEELAPHIPSRLVLGDLQHRLGPVVFVAELIQIAALYTLVSDLPLPLALIVAVAIVAVEATAAIVFGMAVGALVFDERRGPHELSPRQRSMWFGWAVMAGAAMVVIMVVLAVARGQVLIWLPLGVAVAVIAALWGAALYESRYHRRRASLERQLARIRKQGRAAFVAYVAVQETAMGDGRNAVSEARQVLREGDVAFERRWDRIHWREDTPAPRAAEVALPTDIELARRLLLPFPAPLAAELGVDIRPNGLVPPGEPPALPQGD
jgi:hypothetical protein